MVLESRWTRNNHPLFPGDQGYANTERPGVLTRFLVQIQLRTHHELSLFSLCLTKAGDSKTEQWTWAQYLEECKGAIAAPNKLFQEVCVD